MSLHAARRLLIDCAPRVIQSGPFASVDVYLSYSLDIEFQVESSEFDLGICVDAAFFILSNFPFTQLETAALALARQYLLPSFHYTLCDVRSVSVNLRGRRSSGVENEFQSVYLASAEFLLTSERTIYLPQSVGPHETNSWGEVDVLLETSLPEYSRSAGLYRLHVAPSNFIPLHIHRVMREGEMVLFTPSPTALVDRFQRPLQPGRCFRWGMAAHSYTNTSADQWCSLLCVDVPAFIAEDEICLEAADLLCSEGADNRAYHQMASSTNSDTTAESVDMQDQADPFWHSICSRSVCGELDVSNRPACNCSAQCPYFMFPSAVNAPAPLTSEYSCRLIDQSSTPPSNFQSRTMLITCPLAFDMQPDAVVVFAFDSNNRMLLVKHRKRGYELPGGKVNRLADSQFETPETAICRELLEESGLLDPSGIAELEVLSRRHISNLRPIAQYVVFEQNPDEAWHVSSRQHCHVKTVFVCRFNLLSDCAPAAFQSDTSAAIWLPADGLPARQHLSQVLRSCVPDESAAISPLISDGVWDICRRLATVSLLRHH